MCSKVSNKISEQYLYILHSNCLFCYHKRCHLELYDTTYLLLSKSFKSFFSSNEKGLTQLIYNIY